jgi:vacuolar-type H+-ATPase subunit I/STV1
LNFIEWYHYSFVGGGRLFKPLMRYKFKEQL